MRKLILLTIFVCSLLSVSGQKISVGFYNVENLYDTIPSIFYDDTDYTPSGRMSWNTERYNNKLRNIARVIDDMNLDIIGLSEIESEQAVRDLVTTLKTDYCYIHQTSGDRRGMDIVLLYKGDKFMPEWESVIPISSRGALHVRGDLLGESIDLIVCHMPSQLNGQKYREAALINLTAHIDALRTSNRAKRLIVMGDMNNTPSDKLMKRYMGTGKHLQNGSMFLFNALHNSHTKGYGSYIYRDRWLLYDNIFADLSFTSGGALRYLEGGIFIKQYMLSDGTNYKQGYPLRTFYGNSYLNGFSDHLPVYITLQKL